MKTANTLIEILVNIILILLTIMIFRVFMWKIISICEENWWNIKSYWRYYKCEYKSLENRK